MYLKCMSDNRHKDNIVENAQSISLTILTKRSQENYYSMFKAQELETQISK